MTSTSETDGNTDSGRPVMLPGPDHPITIEPTPGRVEARVGGQVIAETASALTLREADYPPVQYIPLADVDAGALRRTDTTSYCPFKGEASYWSIVTDDGELTDAVWGYEHPHAAMAQLAGHIACYADRVEVTAH